jgi:hypothetical protein
VRALAVLAAATPFAFGLIRLIQTGSDGRYLVVAAGAFVGAAAVIRFARQKAAGAAAAVFAITAVLAVVVAMLLGTRLGLGILVVAASFGVCFAAAAWFYVRGSRRDRDRSIN